MGQRSKAGSNWCVILVVMVGMVLAACGSGAEPSGSVSGEPPATAEPPATTEPPDTSTTPFQSEGSQSNPMRLDSPFPYLFDVVGGQVALFDVLWIDLTALGKSDCAFGEHVGVQIVALGIFGFREVHIAAVKILV